MRTRLFDRDWEPASGRKFRDLLFWNWFLMAATFLACANARAGSRLLAWGDLKYDMGFSSPSLTGPTLAQVAAGDFHSVALQGDGTVLAWGDDQFSQTNMPGALAVNPATQIAAGNVHSLALLHDGTVLAWGPPDRKSVV